VLHAPWQGFLQQVLYPQHSLVSMLLLLLVSWQAPVLKSSLLLRW
jgi:hypothetical protein